MNQFNQTGDASLLKQMQRLEQTALTLRKPLTLDSLKVLGTYWAGLKRPPIKFDDPAEFQPSGGEPLNPNWCTSCGWISEITDKDAEIDTAMYCKKYGKIVAYMDECPAGKWKRAEFEGPSIWRL